MELVRYDAMCRAIAEAHAIDEVKELRDKAAALIEYARQAQNTELERQCCEIRVRAERRAGQMLRDMDKAKGSPGNQFTGPLDRNEGSKTLADYRITYYQSSQWQKLAALTEPEFEAKLASVVIPTIGAVLNHRTQGTGDTQWFTPTPYVERVRAVLGEIDLDPASHPVAQHDIRARQFFTRTDDGLTRQWFGKVFLNPPYAQPDIRLFVERLADQIAAGNTTEAILLTNNSTETGWFRTAWTLANVVCLTTGRINFVNREGQSGSPLQGQAFFYRGPQDERFKAEFRPLGIIAIPG
jgi:phage N-6-adenine-methyltransferase